MGKLDFCLQKTKAQTSFAVTVKLISAFVLATRIVQSFFSINSKFQDSRAFLWLHGPICVAPGRKPCRPVFLRRGSYSHDVKWASNNYLSI